MILQDFKDAYILLLSDAAKIVADKGIEWKDENDDICYILFQDLADSSKVIVRWYWDNGNIWRQTEYQNRQRHRQDIWYHKNGNISWQREYKNGQLLYGLIKK